MSALTRYSVPRAVAAGKVNDPQLYFRLEVAAPSAVVLEFLQPLRALEAVAAGAVENSRLYFRAVSKFDIYPRLRRRRR